MQGRDLYTGGSNNGVNPAEQPARAAVRNIVPALRTIEQMTSIINRVDDLDLGMTDNVIEQETEFFKAG